MRGSVSWPCAACGGEMKSVDMGTRVSVENPFMLDTVNICFECTEKLDEFFAETTLMTPDEAYAMAEDEW